MQISSEIVKKVESGIALRKDQAIDITGMKVSPRIPCYISLKRIFTTGCIHRIPRNYHYFLTGFVVHDRLVPLLTRPGYLVFLYFLCRK